MLGLETIRISNTEILLELLGYIRIVVEYPDDTNSFQRMTKLSGYDIKH